MLNERYEYVLMYSMWIYIFLHMPAFSLYLLSPAHGEICIAKNCF